MSVKPGSVFTSFTTISSSSVTNTSNVTDNTTTMQVSSSTDTYNVDNLDIVVEAKAKELALLEYRNIFSHHAIY